VRSSGTWGDGEIVVDVRRHVSGCAFFVFTSVALVIALGYGWSSWHGAPAGLHEAFACLAAAVTVIAIGRVLRFRSHHLLVTTDRVVFVRGVLRRRVDEVLLVQVTKAVSEQRLRDRLVAKGSLRIAVRGFDEPLRVHEITRPRRVAAAINASIASLPADVAEAAVAQADDRDQLAHLEVMRRRGVITYDELAEKRSHLSL
jgi:hypothetical protein